MTEFNYTLVGQNDSIIAQGMSRADAVKRMFSESGHEIEFRPDDEEEPETCLFYRSKDGGEWTPYPLTTAPNEPLTEDHYYLDAIMNWCDEFTIITDTEAQQILLEGI